MNAISLPLHDPELIDWLESRAAAHGVSLEEEASAILRAEKLKTDPTSSDADALNTRWPDLLAHPIKPKPGLDSTLILRAARRAR